MPNPTSKLNLVINGTTTQLDIHDANAVDLTNNQTVGGNKEFTGTTTAHDLVPSATDTYNFGSSSYQWNNAYAKNYFYNGVAWGLDKVNTWTAQQNITGGNYRGSISMYNSAYIKGNTLSVTDLPIGTIYMGDAGQQGISNSLGFISTDLASNGIRTLLSLSAIENTASSTNRTNLVVSYDKNDAENPRKVTIQGTVIPHPSVPFSLGTSTNKWKTFNGINPGALSLPSVSSGINLDLTNFKIDGSDNKFRLTNFTNYPYDNGWLFVRLNGCTSYYLDHWYKVVSNEYVNPSTAIFFMPINDRDHDILLRCVCTSINYIRVFPCQGNV